MEAEGYGYLMDIFEWSMEDNKKSPLAGREKGKEMTLDLLLTQDQGSSIVDGINHLRNLLLSIDLFSGEFA